jgi:hypothetical protein
MNGPISGGQRHGARHVAKDAPGLARLVQIAHDGAADHRPDAGAERLDEARRQQERDVGGKRAGDRGERVERHAAKQHRPTTEAVGERAAHQHHHGEAGDEQADGQLNEAFAGRKIPGDPRQRGQIQVGRDRSHRDQEREQHGEAEAAGAGRGPRCGRAFLLQPSSPKGTEPPEQRP